MKVAQLKGLAEAYACQINRQESLVNMIASERVHSGEGCDVLDILHVNRPGHVLSPADDARDSVGSMLRRFRLQSANAKRNKVHQRYKKAQSLVDKLASCRYHVYETHIASKYSGKHKLDVDWAKVEESRVLQTMLDEGGTCREGAPAGLLQRTLLDMH